MHIEQPTPTDVTFETKKRTAAMFSSVIALLLLTIVLLWCDWCPSSCCGPAYSEAQKVREKATSELSGMYLVWRAGSDKQTPEDSLRHSTLGAVPVGLISYSSGLLGGHRNIRVGRGGVAGLPLAIRLEHLVGSDDAVMPRN